MPNPEKEETKRVNDRPPNKDIVGKREKMKILKLRMMGLSLRLRVQLQGREKEKGRGNCFTLA